VPILEATVRKLLIASIVALVAGSLATPIPAVAQLPEPLASPNISLVTTLGITQPIGARFDRDVMYVTTTTGLYTYDISQPAAPALLGNLALPHFENEDVDFGSDILLISNDAAESTGILYVIDIKDPKSPAILSTFPMGGNPATGGPGHTASCIKECKFAWVSDGAGVRVIDLRDPAAPVDLGFQATDAGGDIAVHDVQVDGNGLAWVVGFGGAVAYKLGKNYDGKSLGTPVAKTNEEGFSTYIEQLGLGTGEGPNDYILHNSRREKNSKVVFVTEEDYTRPGCAGAGAFESWSLPTKTVKKPNGDKVVQPTGGDLTPMDQWVTETLDDPASWNQAPPASAMCSAHYFDLSHNLVAQGWYEQGMRLLDVSNPSNIRQVGYFILPTSMVWASYFAPTDPSRQIIYQLDYTSGVHVLQLDRPAKGSRSTVPCDQSTLSSRERCELRNRPAAVTAPVLPQWTASAPGLPPLKAGQDATWGFACRISGPTI
jgi:hypothetical protein